MSTRGRFHKTTIPALHDTDWQRLSVIFGEPLSEERYMMPHQIGNEAFVDYRLAHALILALGDSGLVDNFLAVYHTCTEPPVAALPLSNGFPRIPWTCEHCKEDVTSLDELRFDVLCRLKQSIEFV